MDRRVVELRLVEQPVAGHVRLHLGDHVADRLRDRVAVGVLRDGAEDGVAHDHRRLGRVEDDDRLAALGAADGLDALAGGLGELVDVGPGARPGRRPRPPTPRSRRRAPRRRATPRTTIGMVAWPPQVIMLTFGASRCSRRFTGGITAGPDGGGRQVDRADARLGVARRGVAVHVGAGGLEHQVGLLVETEQPVDALVAGLQAELARRGPGPRCPGRCRPSSAARATPSAAACTSGRC